MTNVGCEVVNKQSTCHRRRGEALLISGRIHADKSKVCRLAPELSSVQYGGLNTFYFIKCHSSLHPQLLPSLLLCPTPISSLCKSSSAALSPSPASAVSSLPFTRISSLCKSSLCSPKPIPSFCRLSPLPYTHSQSLQVLHQSIREPVVE